MKTLELIDMYKSLNRARYSIENELMERLSWEDLYTFGLTLAAIRKFRETSNPPVSLIDAKKAIEKHFKGRVFT